MPRYIARYGCNNLARSLGFTMPRRFDAYQTLLRRISFLERRIAQDQAELAQHREAIKVYEAALAKAAPPARASGPRRRPGRL